MDGTKSIQRFVFLLSILVFVTTNFSNGWVSMAHAALPLEMKKQVWPAKESMSAGVNQLIASSFKSANLTHRELSNPYNTRVQDIQTTTLYTRPAEVHIAQRGWLDRKIRKSKRLIKKTTREFRRAGKKINRSLRRYRNKLERNVDKGFRHAKRTLRIARRHVKKKYRAAKLFIKRSNRKVKMFIKGTAP